jgi:hypothetical protein
MAGTAAAIGLEIIAGLARPAAVALFEAIMGIAGEAAAGAGMGHADGFHR